MAKWSKHMTLSQRSKYNEYNRRRYLRKQLELGLVPQPRKPATWLLALYREFGVENAIYIPHIWLSKDQLKSIKAESRRIRDKIRDTLPANATRKDVDAAVAVIATVHMLKKFNST